MRVGRTIVISVILATALGLAWAAFPTGQARIVRREERSGSVRMSVSHDLDSHILPQ